jgi:hypothetical protein
MTPTAGLSSSWLTAVTELRYCDHVQREQRPRALDFTSRRLSRLMSRRWLGCVSITVLCLAAPPARADAPVLPASASATVDRELSEQLTQALVAEAQRAFTWRVTWTAINGALGAGSFAALLVLPRSQRPQLIIGGVAAAVGTAFTWLFPLDVEEDAEIAQRLSKLSEPERRRRVTELYAHAAKDELDRVQWQWHVITIIAALVPATIIWVGYRQLVEGLVQALTGVVVGELTLLTQPTRLAHRSMPPAVQVAFTGRGATVSCAFVW